jgi:hypothetical protein
MKGLHSLAAAHAALLCAASSFTAVAGQQPLQLIHTIPLPEITGGVADAGNAKRTRIFPMSA